MHDPMVVAFEIRRPWPRREVAVFEAERRRRGVRWQITFRSPFWMVAGRGFYWPGLVTVWHVEPGGADSGDVCRHYRREQRPDGKWKTTVLNGWRFHIHHWRIQIAPLQMLRRRLLTRCEWCGGPSRSGNAVNVSASWDRERGRWWRGERGLYHVACQSAEHAARSCVCAAPITEHRSWGRCARCNLFRGSGAKPEHLAYTAVMQRCPAGQPPTPELLAEARAASRTASESGAQAAT